MAAHDPENAEYATLTPVPMNAEDEEVVEVEFVPFKLPSFVLRTESGDVPFEPLANTLQTKSGCVPLRPVNGASTNSRFHGKYVWGQDFQSESVNVPD
jgi:hypothetical protein